ncbi:protein-disulfide reductase DsbD domain-containing protein [Deminuibacter soli]|uniref:Sugar transporter n=1 Tax=Deminuibacter soli TaxID=2291815 RepID=A0A3E1NIU8_9BACT|nr:protein-disulfide reductase DsbD domain-containing protein [Deminuibacter soli]RFM27801.1 sugar transporter [Deminuibacter soli]
MKTLYILLISLFTGFTVSSQVLKPVKWSYTAKRTGETTATLFMKAEIQPGWHVYAQSLANGGPVKASFSFTPDASYTLDGEVAEPASLSKFEKAFNANVAYFENTVVFQQKIQLKAKRALVRGTVQFMVCSDRQCLPPQTLAFAVPVK